MAFIFDRTGQSPLFSASDKDLVAAALRPLKWFHRSCLLAHGVTLAGARLTPRERSLCLLLLGNLSEKEIASAVNLSISTTRSYIQSIYRKFGIKGRTGLMSLWLGASK